MERGLENTVSFGLSFFYYLFMRVPVLYAHVCVQLRVLYAHVCVQLCVFYAHVCVLLHSQEDDSPETGSFTESRSQPFLAGQVASKPHQPSQRRSQMCAEKAQLFTKLMKDQNSDPRSCTTGTLTHQAICLPRPCCLLKNKQSKTKQNKTG